MPDLALWKEYVESLGYNPLFVTVSGAHLYGFPSPDSDIDLRGCHLLPLREIVGLNSPQETIEKSGVHAGVEGQGQAGRPGPWWPHKRTARCHQMGGMGRLVLDISPPGSQHSACPWPRTKQPRIF